MTVREAIDRAKEERVTDYSEEQLLRWLNIIDESVNSDIIGIHESDTNNQFSVHRVDTDTLLVPSPYDELYVYYLIAQIDYGYNEYDKYNNDITMYNSLMSDYAAKYNREHKPKTTKFTYF